MTLKVGSRVTFHEHVGESYPGTVVELLDIYYHGDEQQGTVLVRFDDGDLEHMNVSELEEN